MVDVAILEKMHYIDLVDGLGRVYHHAGEVLALGEIEEHKLLRKEAVVYKQEIFRRLKSREDLDE